MKIELLSYRLLRCRFFPLLLRHLVLSLLMLLDDDDDNPFRAYRVSPPVIVLKSAFIVFSLSLPRSPCRATSQQSIELKEFSSFLFYFNANSKETSSDVLRGQSMEEISIQYCRLPKHTIPSLPTHTTILLRRISPF